VFQWLPPPPSFCVSSGVDIPLTVRRGVGINPPTLYFDKPLPPPTVSPRDTAAAAHAHALRSRLNILAVGAKRGGPPLVITQAGGAPSDITQGGGPPSGIAQGRGPPSGIAQAGGAPIGIAQGGGPPSGIASSGFTYELVSLGPHRCIVRCRADALLRNDAQLQNNSQLQAPPAVSLPPAFPVRLKVRMECLQPRFFEAGSAAERCVHEYVSIIHLDT